MSDSANVKSLDAVRLFAAAVHNFREEAKLCITRLEIESRKIINWLERDRPAFWKREAETCDRKLAEARVMLHTCRMRRVGDFRPTCFEEQKRVEHCKQQLKFAQQQLGVVKHWTIVAQQESEEYYGRAVQLVQMLEHDVPQLIALLNRVIENLDSYNKVQLPSWSPSKLDFGDTSKYSPPAIPDGGPVVVDTDDDSGSVADVLPYGTDDANKEPS